MSPDNRELPERASDASQVNMPQLLPFAGLRPNPSVVGRLDDVVCPPYDVITNQQRLALLARSPYHVVRIELPAGQYEQAAELLARWQSTGALLREASPVLYGYRMTYPGAGGEARHTLGVLGALALDPTGGGVLPHEQTMPKAKTDRLELIRATHANTSPIWCLCAEAGLVSALGAVPSGPGATASVVDDEGNSHEIWPITDPVAQSEVARVTGAGPLLVADGHHRYETALAYQAEQAAGSPRGTTADGPGAVLAFVVELAEEHLQILAIHRVVAGLPAGTDVLDAFREGFELHRATSQGSDVLEEMTAASCLAIATPRGTFLARPRPGSSTAAYDLCSSQVDAAIADLPAHRLSYEHDVDGAFAAVDKGQADAAIFCRPPSVAQIAATAHGGVRMPPKTTFFWPKPRTGMVLRSW